MKIIFDTNVLISSILIEGSIADLALTKAEKFHEIVCSEKVYNEISIILHLAKFDKYVSTNRRNKFLQSFKIKANFVTVDQTIEICRDPKDNMFLELAVSAKADYIITGDKDLLELNPFKGIRIISPKEYVEKI
ncbi:MAG TPA: putative toxin-antitoxin system toxin component, PIN family [Tangfeifania sp.]|nr:putative toxin-antitoxin system toxin component, PIN family [Tangfeifania sp.]